MLGRLFQKKGVHPREPLESSAIAPHWSEVEREIPPHYFEWIAGITEQLRKDYRESLPPNISNKCKRKFVKVIKNS